MFKNKKAVIFFFSFICILLTGPSFYLLSNRFADYNERYKFTYLELVGIEHLNDIMADYSELLQNKNINLKSFQNSKYKNIFEKNTLNVTPERLQELEKILSIPNGQPRDYYADKYFSSLIRFVANYSNLILDPELAPCYLMDVAVLKIPRIYQLLSRENSDKKFIINEMSDIQYSLYIAFNEDPKEAGRIHLNDSNVIKNFSKIKNNFENEIFNGQMFSEAALADELLKFDRDVLKDLKTLLSNRLIEMKSNERILLEMTLLIWVLGMSLGFFLFIKMWNTQKVLWSTVSSQTQLLEKNDKLTMLGEMAAGVAHEIASPIQIILFANYKLANFTEFNQSEILKYTGQIDKMLSQIKFIVKSIKAFSHHSEQTETVSIDLKNSLDEALMIVQFKIKEHRVIIDIDPSVQKFKVMATEPELVQIFVNLINNSVDALSNQTDRIIKISATQNENKWVEIHVADNGPGVPVNKREKIFETLFTTKKYGKGTGIGLSLSRKIAESHGGQLILESSEIGADFKIILSEG